jgi:Uma2 family endonuclease
MPPAPNLRHQAILGRLYVAFHTHVEAGRLGHVYLSPVDVVLDRERPLVLQPDLVFVSTARQAILGDRIYGAPDLVVEVFSPGGATFDRTEKVAWYARYGVLECWLVDPDAETVEVRQLLPGGIGVLGVFRGRDLIRSRVLPEFSPVSGDLFSA